VRVRLRVRVRVRARVRIRVRVRVRVRVRRPTAPPSGCPRVDRARSSRLVSARVRVGVG